VCSSDLTHPVSGSRKETKFSPDVKLIYDVSDETMLTSMSEGDEIEFIVERRNGKLTIIELN